MSRSSPPAVRLYWKVFTAYAVLTALALGISAYLIIREFESFYDVESTMNLRELGGALRGRVQGRLDNEHADELNEIARSVGTEDLQYIRVTLADAGGTILADSHLVDARGRAIDDRDEFRDALADGWGVSTRWSTLDTERLKFVALRVGPRDRPEGVVRVALTAKTIGERTDALTRIIWIIALTAVAASAAFGYGLARLLTRPIRRFTAIAGRISRGDLSARARVEGNDELSQLAAALNDMRDHIQRQIETAEFQRTTLTRLLNEMKEGLIVAGADGRILIANPAAARMLGSGAGRDADSWIGRLIERCIPQHDVQQMLLVRRDGTSSGEPTVAEIRVDRGSDDGPVVLRAMASDIHLPVAPGDKPASEYPYRLARAVTLSDVTVMARTLQMKTDFASNASHELRTPLAAIRGAVETLAGLDDTEGAGDIQRFVNMVDRHTSRLEQLVRDLLALSRVESPSTRVRREAIGLAEFLDEFRERWTEFTGRKHITLDLDLPEDLEHATADRQLAGLALNNLLENAVKFTPENGRITVACRRVGDELAITVQDTGCGIPAEHQERVFERFYQVESARTGSEARGTGLGLAIVRHAVVAMGGRVSLESEPGKGTRVTLHIPQPRAQNTRRDS